MAKGKTNAMRILDAKKIEYAMFTYENKDGKIDGVSVAEKTGRELQTVFKTLVAQGTSKAIYVFVIPVQEELDLKKAAKAAGEKKVEMIAVKDIQKHTGYIRGGCSPIGMKKLYPTYIHSSAKELEKVVVSGGKIGVQIEISPNQLQEVVAAVITDVVKVGE